MLHGRKRPLDCRDLRGERGAVAARRVRLVVTVVRNAGWLLAGRIVADALGLLFYLALARRFGEAGLGDFAFAFALAAVSGLLVRFGFDAFLTREVARSSSLSLARPVLRLQSWLALLGAAGLAGASLIAGWSGPILWLIALAYAHVALMAMARTFVAHLQATERMASSAAAEVAARTTLVTVGLLLLAAGASLPVVTGAYVLGGATYLLLAGILTREAFKAEGRLPVSRSATALIRAALPFAVAVGLYELYSRADLILLHMLRGEIETGRYAAAWKLVTVPLFVPSLLGVSIYPMLSREGSGKSSEIRAAYALFVKWMVLLGGTGGALLLVSGDGAFRFLYGADFENAAHLVRWMAPLFFVEFAKVPYWRLLFATDRERTVLVAQGSAVLLNIVLNVVLIPRHGAIGAVWASLLSQGLEYVALVRLAGRELPDGLGSRAFQMAFVLLVGIAVGLALRPVTPWWVSAPVTAATILGVAAVSGLARPGELGALRGAPGFPGSRPEA